MGMDQPIGSGLIFVSDSPASFEETEDFNGFTFERYEQWKLEKEDSGTEWASNDPIGFFRMEDQVEVVCQIDHAKPAKFVFLKPTGYRTKPVNLSSHFDKTPISIQFFGVLGVEIDSTDSVYNENMNHLQLKSKQNIYTPVNSQYSLSIQVTENPEAGQWETVSEVHNVEASLLKSDKELQIKDGHIHFEKGTQSELIAHLKLKSITSKQIKGVRLLLGRPESEHEWDLESVVYDSIEDVFQSKKIKLDISPGELKRIMTSEESFEKITGKVFDITMDNRFVKEIRVEAMHLLQKIISLNNNILHILAEKIIIKNFLNLNILNKDKYTCQNAFQFLALLSLDPQIKHKVSDYIINEVEKVPTHKMSSWGISSL